MDRSLFALSFGFACLILLTQTALAEPSPPCSVVSAQGSSAP